MIMTDAARDRRAAGTPKGEVDIMKKLLTLALAAALALAMLTPAAMAEGKDNWLRLF